MCPPKLLFIFYSQVTPLFTRRSIRTQLGSRVAPAGRPGGGTSPQRASSTARPLLLAAAAAGRRRGGGGPPCCQRRRGGSSHGLVGRLAPARSEDAGAAAPGMGSRAEAQCRVLLRRRGEGRWRAARWRSGRHGLGVSSRPDRDLAGPLASAGVVPAPALAAMRVEFPASGWEIAAAASWWQRGWRGAAAQGSQW
jgi:hypothetical protein